jgi:predicted alpha/beta superfamily hydrolase
MLKYFLQFLIIVILFLSCSDSTTTEPEEENYLPQLAENLYSTIVADTLKLYIQLPNNYDHEKPGGYNVLYVLDGDWLTFGTEGYLDDIGGTAGFADSLRRDGQMPEVIIIGIGYPNENHRHRDYLFPFDSINSASGGGEKFYQFLKNELIPKIDQTFNTKGSEGRSLLGHSASGYFTMYAFFRYNEQDGIVFNNFLASSPNVYYHDYYLNELAAECNRNNSNPIPTKLYWSHGDGKFEVSQETIEKVFIPVESCNRFNFKLEIFPEENHTWVIKKSFYYGLMWLFSSE